MQVEPHILLTVMPCDPDQYLYHLCQSKMSCSILMYAYCTVCSLFGAPGKGPEKLTDEMKPDKFHGRAASKIIGARVHAITAQCFHVNMLRSTLALAVLAMRGACLLLLVAAKPLVQHQYE